MFAACADGESHITGLADGADVASTVAVLRGIGVHVGNDGSGITTVTSGGFESLKEPDGVLECGNSGSTLRMMAGLLAGRPLAAVLAGDASLSTRPMGRVIEPLRAMGATIDGSDGGTHAPITLRGGPLRGVRHELQVASGQVKTALVLAGMQADGLTEIVEPNESRDHTERMLAALGASVEQSGSTTLRVRRSSPVPFDLVVPGDTSSAAFLVVAATIIPGSTIVIEGVSLNPRRIAYLDVLRSMGGNIEVREIGVELGEPVGEVSVSSANLRAADIVGTESIIDEIPVLAVAAAFADGTTTISGAAELVVKESNRITTMVDLLTRFGVTAEPTPDGVIVRGGAPVGARVDSFGDHRIALCGAVAGLAATGETTVENWSAVDVSYPTLSNDLASLLGAA